MTWLAHLLMYKAGQHATDEVSPVKAGILIVVGVAAAYAVWHFMLGW